MERYKNLSGISSVAAYETGPDFIRIQFTDGAVYRYTNASAGEAHIIRMKTLAAAGRGLNSFIDREVQNAFADREQ
jgi:hypothetical protein